ncbi:peptide synthetase [Colletotrichum tofieldiae]|nr:peptide synthetase [Colletotrichum tofieldiae]
MIRDLVSKAYNGEQLHIDDSFNTFVGYIVNQSTEAAEFYWNATMAGYEPAPFPQLPATISRPAPNSEVDVSCSLRLSKRLNVTTASVLRAAWDL